MDAPSSKVRLESTATVCVLSIRAPPPLPGYPVTWTGPPAKSG